MDKPTFTDNKTSSLYENDMSDHLEKGWNIALPMIACDGELSYQLYEFWSCLMGLMFSNIIYIYIYVSSGFPCHDRSTSELNTNNIHKSKKFERPSGYD